MKNLFKVVNLDYHDKIGNLKTEAHSQVKSTKYFPIYHINGKKMIFKPLSKTKPLTTPLFAYSEVYWSYVINKYFDSKAPRYYLAVSKGIEKEESKYYENGVLVESITRDDERLINLYDYFNEHPDPSVDIKDYINYCMINYDYTKILLSDFIKNNYQLGEDLAYQILLSILRQDRNFHYENINFISNNEGIFLAPPIDFEFSIPFLYPDKEKEYSIEQYKYTRALEIPYEEDTLKTIFKKIQKDAGLKSINTIVSNICLIVKLFLNAVLKFIKNLEEFIQDLPQITLSDPDNYIGPLNSDYWEVGHAFFKEKDLVKTEALKERIKLNTIDKKQTFNKISFDISSYSKLLNLVLKIYIVSFNNGIEDLEDLTIRQLLDKLNIKDNVTIEDVDIYTKELKLGKASNILTDKK